MKLNLILTLVSLTLALPALAADPTAATTLTVAELQKQLADAIAGATAALDAPTPPPSAAVPAEDPNLHSPSMGFAGIVLGTSLGRVSGSGTDASVQGGIRARAFGEGSSGPNGTIANEQEVGWLKYRLSTTVYAIANAKLAALGISDPLERARTFNNLVQDETEALDAKLADYSKALERKRAFLNSRPSRPLYVAEFDANYNMVGSSNMAGAQPGMYTGATIHGKAGVGFAMKDYGKKGCTMYFLAQANVDGAAYYKLENADTAQINAGIEQGPLCQIGHAVTFMMSPSVQVGGAWHELPEGTVTDSGWLNYAGHMRLIVDNKLYLAANAVYRPAMGGSTWSSSQLDGTADYKISDQWYVGLDGKSSQFTNTAANAQGTTHVIDNRLNATATLIF